MYQYRIKRVNSVLDGDTVDLDIDLGFSVTISERIKLRDIDAPELKSSDSCERAKASDAKEYLKAELSREGEWMILTSKDTRYGKILGIIYRLGDQISVNQKMLDEGFALPHRNKDVWY